MKRRDYFLVPLFISVIFFSLIIFGSCTGKDDDSEADVTAERAIDIFAKDYMKKAGSCAEDIPVDEASRIEQDIIFIINRSIENGDSTYNPSSLSECRTALSEADCDALAPNNGFSAIPECASLFSGNLSAGDECVTFGCAAGLTCIAASGPEVCGAGICSEPEAGSDEIIKDVELPQLVEQGGACDIIPPMDTDLSICEGDYTTHYCKGENENSTSGICTIRPGIGESCSDDEPCNPEIAYCSSAGTCSERSNEGSACSVSAACAGGLVCLSGICTAGCSEEAIASPPANALCDYKDVSLDFDDLADGCNMPDKLKDPWESQFRKHCLYHDRCYHTCPCGKSVCDKKFLTSMAGYCYGMAKNRLWSKNMLYYCYQGAKMVYAYASGADYISGQELSCSETDADGDGDYYLSDCDDSDSNRSSLLAEIAYNGIDDDCNNQTPDDDLDRDGDPNATDCDDRDPARSSIKSEIANNGIDDDCNANTPTSCPATSVGVISSFNWEGGYAQPLDFQVYVSANSRNHLLQLLHSNLLDTSVSFLFEIHSYDSNAQKYFRSVHSNDQILSGFLAKDGGELNLYVDDIANEEVVTPRNYLVSFSVEPPEFSQDIHIATSVGHNGALTWGVTLAKVGSFSPFGLSPQAVISEECSVWDGFNFSRDRQETVGYLTELTIGGIQLDAYISHLTPVDLSGDCR